MYYTSSYEVQGRKTSAIKSHNKGRSSRPCFKGSLDVIPPPCRDPLRDLDGDSLGGGEPGESGTRRKPDGLRVLRRERSGLEPGGGGEEGDNDACSAATVDGRCALAKGK